MLALLRTLGLLLLVVLVTAQRNKSESDNFSGDIVYPNEDTVWKVGEHVNVTFRPTVPPKETVAIFFANYRDVTLGGGGLEHLVFPFVVPAGAVSPPNGKSLLLAIRRNRNYLNSVDGVSIKVVY